jgi:hypothetical protein
VAVAEIISKGHVPVLSIALPEDAENNKNYLPCVEVLDSSDPPNYKAISMSGVMGWEIQLRIVFRLANYNVSGDSFRMQHCNQINMTQW